MMRTIIIGLFISLFLSCHAQQKDIMNNSTASKNLIYPEVDKSFEKFDLNKLDTITGINIVKSKNGDVTEYQKQSTGYIIRFQPQNSYFTLIKKFFKSGQIESKGLIFNSGDFRKGTWYFFDENGTALPAKNFDSDFSFSFENLYDQLIQMGIPLTIGNLEGGFNTTIQKETQGKPKWSVEWLKDTSTHPNIIERIDFDGTSGKIIHREQYEYTNN